MRAIHMYCDLVSGAVLDGLQAELAASGIDIGARAELPAECPSRLPTEPADGRGCRADEARSPSRQLDEAADGRSERRPIGGADRSRAATSTLSAAADRRAD